MYGPREEAGLTRRQLLGGAAAALGAWGLGGCGGIRGRRLDELDPRVPALLAAATSVDFHTHAAGAGNARVPRSTWPITCGAATSPRSVSATRRTGR